MCSGIKIPLCKASICRNWFIYSVSVADSALGNLAVSKMKEQQLKTEKQQLQTELDTMKQSFQAKISKLEKELQEKKRHSLIGQLEHQEKEFERQQEQCKAIE